MQINKEALKILVKIIKDGDFIDSQGPIGHTPSEFARDVKVNSSNVENILGINYRLGRENIFNMVKDKEINDLELCLAIMAWGGQMRGAKNGRLFFSVSQQEKWLSLFNNQRNNPFDRAEAYEEWLKLGPCGCGPAYFTKILFFLDRNRRSYIMDQWTAKSMHLLTSHSSNSKNPKITNGHLPRNNTPENYESFCAFIEKLARELSEQCNKDINPHQAEQIIFSSGGRPPGTWRAYVRENWPVRT